MKKIFELKEENKKQAAQIKLQKAEVKKTQKEGKYAGLLQLKLVIAKKEYRKHHIAYCLLRGKLYEQIEKPKEQNKLNDFDWEEIQKIQEAYHEENVCACS